MEPTDAQFLIINALETLEVLIQQTFDPETNNWYILTLSEDLPIAMIVPSGKVVGVNLPVNTSTIQNSQSLVLDALATLNLLQLRVFDRETGNYYIQTPSSVLPIAIILSNGEIVPIDWDV